MFGQALPAPIQVPRFTPPDKEMKAKLGNLAAHNARVIAETMSSGEHLIGQQEEYRRGNSIRLRPRPICEARRIPADVARLVK